VAASCSGDGRSAQAFKASVHGRIPQVQWHTPASALRVPSGDHPPNSSSLDYSIARRRRAEGRALGLARGPVSSGIRALALWLSPSLHDRAMRFWAPRPRPRAWAVGDLRHRSFTGATLAAGPRSGCLASFALGAVLRGLSQGKHVPSPQPATSRAFFRRRRAHGLGPPALTLSRLPPVRVP